MHTEGFYLFKAFHQIVSFYPRQQQLWERWARWPWALSRAAQLDRGCPLLACRPLASSPWLFVPCTERGHELTDSGSVTYYLCDLCFDFGLCWVFTAVWGLSLVVVSGWLLSSCGLWASHCGGSSCAAVGRTVWVQELWRTGLAALRYVGSSGARNWTCVSCIGRRILNHWTTRVVPSCVILRKFLNISGLVSCSVKDGDVSSFLARVL